MAESIESRSIKMLFHIFELYFIVMYTVDGSFALTFAIKNVGFLTRDSDLFLYRFLKYVHKKRESHTFTHIPSSIWKMEKKISMLDET